MTEQQTESIFDFLAVLPAETYADHMRLAYDGWNEFEPEEQADTPWIAHGLLSTHGVDTEIHYRTMFARAAFEALGGTAVSRVLIFSSDELEDYCEKFENQDRFGCWEVTDIIAAVCRFLSSQCTDEECASLLKYNK